MEKPIKAAVITVSDRTFRGERTDLSGSEVQRLLENAGFQVLYTKAVPDERSAIASVLKECADKLKIDLIVTTGGTGVSPRDVTPEATRDIIDKEIPGMAEAMRIESLKKTPYAMISRAVVGIRGETLIVNLPGSPQGARENLEVILPALPHALEKIKGDERDCVV
ncbi:MAG: MogA/MoaB family molybdenum cofactor biosynthesis protein [Syntrophales bacterium]|nr:MogA/MoaB family molybdenum cofactor biosynthesis protein [Syntrophales bacterium]